MTRCPSTLVYLTIVLGTKIVKGRSGRRLKGLYKSTLVYLTIVLGTKMVKDEVGEGSRGCINPLRVLVLHRDWDLGTSSRVKCRL